MKRNEPEGLAQRRAEMIVLVQSGQLTATEAARRLGVSRKTYYQWERRALEGMVGALGEKASGRPPKIRDEQKEALQKRLGGLEERERIRAQVERIRSVVAESKDSAEKK